MDNKRFDFPVRNICDIIIKDLQGNYYDINIEIKMEMFYMSEKRFKLDFDIDKIKQRFFVKIGKKVQIIDQEQNHKIRDLYDACEVLNEQQEEITYWKHRVSSLLMILSQFDNEKVKKLLEELEE